MSFVDSSRFSGVSNLKSKVTSLANGVGKLASSSTNRPNAVSPLAGVSSASSDSGFDVRARIKTKPSQLSNLIDPQKQVTGSNTPSPSQTVLGKKDDDTNILLPLYETNGMMFPTTPTLSLDGQAMYEPLGFTHSNYDQQSYSKSMIGDITISGAFPAQTLAEARYLIACIHFLRTVTKMYFGNSNTHRVGAPPPVLLFSYLGGMFNDVPIVITSYTTEFPNDVDLINVEYSTGIISVPVLMNLTVTMRTQYNPYKVRQEFNLDEFRTGKMLKKGYI